MGTNIKPEDLEFLRWLESKEAEEFWDLNEHGEKQILREGWEKNPDRIRSNQGLKGKFRNRLTG